MNFLRVVSIPRKYLWKVDTFRSVVGMSSLVAEIALAAIIEADLENFFVLKFKISDGGEL